MQKYKFVLKSILIHEGTDSESGHYYAYIRDSIKEIWRRYDDTTIREEKESVVFEKSQGGPDSNSSAYFLVYQRASSITPNTKLPIINYALEG